jgi:hypothetical protein
MFSGVSDRRWSTHDNAIAAANQLFAIGNQKPAGETVASEEFRLTGAEGINRIKQIRCGVEWQPDKALVMLVA